MVISIGKAMAMWRYREVCMSQFFLAAYLGLVGYHADHSLQALLTSRLARTRHVIKAGP